VWNDALFLLEEKHWIWNSFVSSSIPHWQCSKQTPVEGALLCWSFNLLSIFQPRSVSFPYFCIFKLTLMRENYRWSETTASLLGFSTCRSTNRFLQRELCHDEVLYLLLFSSSNLAFLHTTVFQCGNWWHKFSHCLKLLHPLLHSPLAELQTGFCGESSATSKFDDCSCFQTRSDSLAYSNVSVLKLMRQIFVAYESTTFPLAFPTGRSINKSLQRELCNVEVQCLIMVFFSFFFYILCCWTGIELTVGVTSKKTNAPCTEG
jgi:hypothetical protein